VTSDPRTPARHRPKLEIVSIEGELSETERRAVEEALTEAVEEQRTARRGSLWARSGRAQGRRLGMYDYRDRFSSDDAWRLSVRFPAGGREYPGLNGRGDAK
jgi:hypothetical protein